MSFNIEEKIKPGSHWGHRYLSDNTYMYALNQQVTCTNVTCHVPRYIYVIHKGTSLKGNIQPHITLVLIEVEILYEQISESLSKNQINKEVVNFK